MNEPQPENEGVAEAVVDTRRRPSIVWLIPLVAALVGGFVAWRTFSERGPAISITLDSADGLEAGKTKVRYKNVEIGLVEEVELADDLSSVICHARMVKGADEYLREGTRFWVVKARVTGGQVSDLGTIFSGAYIGIDPVREGPARREFQALDVPPVVTSGEPGRHFALRSYGAGAIDVGSPVYFRKVQVGEVVASELDASGDFAMVRVFVHAPHDERVRAGTRFWNASGIDVSLDAEGVRVDTESVVSMLIGGVAFDTPVDGADEPAAADAVFPLYESRAATREEMYTLRTHYLLYFDQSVRGLVPGSPVEFRGIRIGQVRDVKLEVDPSGQRFRIPVVIEVEPERIGHLPGDVEARRAGMDTLVARGLRAQLARGNLLTGQLLVALDMHEGAPPAQIVWQEPYPEFPTIPTPLEEITASLTQLVKRIEKIPFDQIGADLRGSLSAAQAALTQAEKTMVSTQALVGPDSAVNQDLRRALFELSDAARSLGLAADQIEREPDSLLWGKGRN
jgi:paraquat-inducible protein B